MTEAEEILALDDRDYIPVKVPEWGRDGFAASMSGEELREWHKFCAASKEENGNEFDSARVHVWLTVNCWRNAEKHRVFKSCLEDGFAAQCETLIGKNSAVHRRVAETALKVNKLVKESVEETKKNSEAAPTSDSGTPSPGI